jgi:hypothetical protein
MSLFQPFQMPQNDMSTMYAGPSAMPQGMPPQQPAQMPIMSDGPTQGDIPSYMGDPMLDKYIHQFLGASNV